MKRRSTGLGIARPLIVVAMVFAMGFDGCAPGHDCNPVNAIGAVTKAERVMLDLIAWAEGTYRWNNKDGYNVMFTYATFSSCNQHPNITNCSGQWCSTAAGRYQYLKGSWDELGYPDFHPGHQDRGARKTIKQKRGVSLPATRAMTTSELVAAMDKLSWEWASLPYNWNNDGRYGQPTKTMQQVVNQYTYLASFL